MADLRDETHRAVLAAVRGRRGLEALLSRGDQRRLVPEVCAWYLELHGDSAGRNGTCVVVTAGPPGAGKSSVLPVAASDLSTRLVIDADVAKSYLADWCVEHDVYADLLATELPDGGTIKPLELSPLLQTMSTESCNLVRRAALAARMDVLAESTMSSSGFGDRLLLSLAKADYDELLIVSVEVDRGTAQSRAIERWWSGRFADPRRGGRLVLPETIEAAYAPDGQFSRCRDNARSLVAAVRRGRTAIDRVTIAEYDAGVLTRMDADPPRVIEQRQPGSSGG